jgi:uncharacterized membrane protein YebE (DUF533 family)
VGRKVIKVVILCCPLILMCGCTAFWKAFGINEDGTVQPGGGTLGTVATLVNYWIPGTTLVTGAVTTLLGFIKARNWKAALASTAEVIEKGAMAGKAVADIKEDLKVAHAKAGVAGIVDKVVQTVSAKVNP